MKYGKFWGVILISASVGLVGCGNTDTTSKNVDLPDTIYLNDLSVQYDTIEIPEI